MKPNYFDFYNLPVAFNVDATALRRIYLDNNRKFHPDFYTLASPAQQEEALERSTRNNEAYKVLSDPDARMKHILDLYGLWEEEGQQTAALPQDFLMEMMDMNEELMDLEMEYDAAKHALLQQQLHALETQMTNEITQVTDRWSPETGTVEELAAVKNFFLKKRYLLRIQKKLLTFAPA